MRFIFSYSKSGRHRCRYEKRAREKVPFGKIEGCKGKFQYIRVFIRQKRIKKFHASGESSLTFTVFWANLNRTAVHKMSTKRHIGLRLKPSTEYLYPDGGLTLSARREEANPRSLNSRLTDRKIVLLFSQCCRHIWNSLSIDHRFATMSICRTVTAPTYVTASQNG